MVSETITRPLDEAKVESFLGQVACDFGATLSTILAYIGDKLGLYRALAEAGPMTPKELAGRTGTAERYVEEWLLNQGASGYLTYDPQADRYALPPEHALILTDEDSPFYVGGGFQVVSALTKAEPRITEAIRTGEGVAWGEHHPDLFTGTERFFRPGYRAHLVSEWIPALNGVEEKIRRGGLVADIGCGHGASTIIMAQAYPRSRFTGFDSHAPSIERARQAAEEAGVADRVVFETTSATEYPGEDYDLIAFFDCLHDMGHPKEVACHAARALADEGTVMLVEPMAGKTVEENFNPVGRIYSAASVLCCTPNALACGGPALGTVATDDALKSVMQTAGFSRFRRATETPFNRVFEARL